MKIYKSPWVSYESYFVKTGEEGNMTTGYSIELLNGIWIVVKTKYVTRDIKMMPVAAENNIDLKDVFKDAILSAVHDAKDGERR